MHSAAAKLVQPEAESAALAEFLVERIALPMVSSALIYPELTRAVTRHRPELAHRALALLQRIMMVPLANDIVANAATGGHPMLRTLDALHLATAVSVAGELRAFVSYDKRLAEAAAGIGLTVAMPG